MRRVRNLCVSFVGLLCIAIVFDAAAQIDPQSAFSISYSVEKNAERLKITPIVQSARTTISTFGTKADVTIIDVEANHSFYTQSDVLSIDPNSQSAAGKLLVEGTNIASVKVMFELSHLQEGWIIQDSFYYQAQLSPKPVKNPSVASDPNFLEIDGLVIDRSITKGGQDFYGLFYQNWEAPFGARSFSIILEESPWRGRQTMMKVSIDDQLIFQRVLQTRYDALEEMALQAAGYAYQVLRARVEATQSRDGESGEFLEQF